MSIKHDSADLVACIPRLRRYARALVGNRTDADDLVQDTMERGWRNLTSWQRGGDMRAWLFSIMHNLYVDQIRKGHVRTEELNLGTPEPSVNGMHGDRLDVRDIELALGLLSMEQRQVVLLVALEEMTYEEIAAALRIPKGTVMSRLSRGRERLRALTEGRPIVSPMKVVK
jgi:RNA polymerase sigma factor (sigma-70 family)